MRAPILVLSLLTALVLCVGGFAQQNAGSWAGTDPRSIQFKPIDTSKALKLGNTANAFHAAPQAKGFGMSHFFPKLSFGSWPPRIARAGVLDPKQNVFQPKPPKGFNPFDAAKKK